MRIVSLCTGYGGLDMAAEALLGGRVVAVSDIDEDVARLLEVRYPGIPNVGDITADPDLPAADVVTAGFPCQPFSTAGNRKGADDERFIWPHIAAAIGRMDPRPGLLMLENVPGLLTIDGGDVMARVVSDLAGLGYVGAWRLLRASSVGACHQRRRWFCVASYADGGRVRPVGGSDRRDDGVDGGGEPEVVSAWPEVAHAEDTPQGSYLPTPQSADSVRGPDYARARNRRESHGSGGDDLTTAIAKLLPTPNATDHKGTGRQAERGHGGDDLPTVMKHLPTPTTMLAEGGNKSRSGDRRDELLLGGILRSHDPEVWGPYAAALDRHVAVMGVPAPSPVTDGKLDPRFVEWMMMLPAGWVTDPSLRFSRSAQLRMLGNGVVPLQAYVAFASLLTDEEAA